MGAVSISQFITLYAWFVLAFMLLFLMLIARHYQRFASIRTHYAWFALPILLFGAATMRYSSVNQIAGDPAADVMLGIAGLALLGLSLFLYSIMTRR